MKKISLEELLAFRENRACRRKKILKAYPLSLACLSLNIPGDCKDFPWARRSFQSEIDIFSLALEAEGIDVSNFEREEENAGYTAYFSAEAEPKALKTIALYIEETHPLGRLFDIDIYNGEGEKLSREDSDLAPRPCLICEEDSFLCARNQAHSPEELEASVAGLMENWFRQKLGETIVCAANWSMLNELIITPKPGLVDRVNNGAHKDMDFFTFVNSATVLLPWFRSCALAGFNSVTKGLSPQALFESLRPAGRIAEVIMKKATNGVNTHKGYIFSVGILSAAYGRLYRNAENPCLTEVLDFTKEMCKDLADDFSRSPSKKPSHGEVVFSKTGIKGIRGEVSRGFPTVAEHALPLLRDLLNEDFSMNDAGIITFLKILAHAEDSNIIHREDKAALDSIQKNLRTFFASFTMAQSDPSVAMDPDMGVIREKVVAMNREFIVRNISPGGSADLLGVSFFLYRLFYKNTSQ